MSSVPRLAHGVGTEQVVEDIPAGCVLADQAVPDQVKKLAPGVSLADSGQSGRGGGRDVGTGPHAHEPEHAC